MVVSRGGGSQSDSLYWPLHTSSKHGFLPGCGLDVILNVAVVSIRGLNRQLPQLPQGTPARQKINLLNLQLWILGNLILFKLSLFIPVLLAATQVKLFQVVSVSLSLSLSLFTSGCCVSVKGFSLYVCVCMPPTHSPRLPACLLEGPLLTTPALLRIRRASLVPWHPFPLPNVCAVFLILLSYTLVYMYYVCAYMHTHTCTHIATCYKWALFCCWSLSSSSHPAVKIPQPGFVFQSGP